MGGVLDTKAHSRTLREWDDVVGQLTRVLPQEAIGIERIGIGEYVRVAMEESTAHRDPCLYTTINHLVKKKISRVYLHSLESEHPQFLWAA
jgi:hypothetical protein